MLVVHLGFDFYGSDRLIDSVLKVIVGVLLLEVRHVELALVDRALVQVPSDLLRRAILLPVVDLEPLLHLVILFLVPEAVVGGFDPAEDSDC